MARMSNTEEAVAKDPQLGGPMATGDIDMFSEFVAMDGSGDVDVQGVGQEDQKEQDDLARDLHILASIPSDQPLLVGHPPGSNMQIEEYYYTPHRSFVNCSQTFGMSVAPKNLEIERGSDEEYEQFFQDMVDSDPMEDNCTSKKQSAFMGFDNQADEVASNSPETLEPRLSSQRSQHCAQLAVLEDVFTEKNVVPDNVANFQEQLRANQGPVFNLQSPPRASKATSYPQSMLAPEDALVDPTLRCQSTRNYLQPGPNDQPRLTGFSAHRKQHAENNAVLKAPANRDMNATMNERLPKRPRVAFGEKAGQQHEKGAMFTNKTDSLPGVPTNLILRSNQDGPKGGNIVRQQTHNKTQQAGVPRKQSASSQQSGLKQQSVPRQQSVAPRSRGTEPGSSSFNGQDNPPSAHALESSASHPIDLTLDDFDSDPCFNPDRLLASLTIPHGSLPSPGIRSPINPSFNFPFHVFKYPTGEDVIIHLTWQELKVLLDNFFYDVTNFPVMGVGRLAPAHLLDVAVYYFKGLNWDNGQQLKMIYLITILRNSQQTDLHQWLWEVYTVACMVLKKYPQRNDVLRPIESIKWHIVRLTLILLKHDITCYQTRENPVFGRTLGPAVWKVQHHNVSGWDALGITKAAVNNVHLWLNMFLQKATGKFVEANIDPRESVEQCPQAEDYQGYL
ncbi:hypothetical protein BKA61DRAFT_263147 [Leptodontidium sp. MPI-SDFR-AT-0119]|nr:hypothetical protein BKA61DRAFT_263147 [Leptodontidium sp. MPI-SDFR-AT-0119]